MTLYPVEFSPKAKMELQEAYAWYEERQEDLGERFLIHVHHKIEIISEFPERYRKVKGIIRQVSITKFPYYITYYVKPKQDVIIIVSVFHHSRNPNDRFR